MIKEPVCRVKVTEAETLSITGSDQDLGSSLLAKWFGFYAKRLSAPSIAKWKEAKEDSSSQGCQALVQNLGSFLIQFIIDSR